MSKKHHAITPFENLWTPMFPFSSPIVKDEFLPALNIEDKKTKLVVTAELAGFDPEDVKVEIDGDYLVLSGEHKEDYEKEEKNYLHHEYSQGSFYRKVYMPENATLEKAEGKVKNGLLTITIPKTKTKENKTNCVPIKIEK